MILAKTGILMAGMVTIIFMICESGEQLTIEFGKIDFYIDWSWYLFPMSVQRVLPIISMNTQEPMILRGVGNAQCSRETLKKVI